MGPDKSDLHILHVDMDAFFASVEQRDDPSLRGKAVVVGGSGPRSVVMAASYEARRFGIHSAMPMARARKLCAALVIQKPRMDIYRDLGGRVHRIFARHTSIIEPLGLDEAYLDVSRTITHPSQAVSIAREIKQEILGELELSASAGVSFNKFLAKIASGMDKPDGLSIIEKSRALDVIASLPIEKFHGIGPATSRRLRAHGIDWGKDLQDRSEFDLARNFGSLGRYLFLMSRAQDSREVSSTRIRKSLSAERTFDQNLTDLDQMIEAVSQVCGMLTKRLLKGNFRGKTITLKIKDDQFQVSTRSMPFPSPPIDQDKIVRSAIKLLKEPYVPRRPVRLLGVSIGNPVSQTVIDQYQLDLD